MCEHVMISVMRGYCSSNGKSDKPRR